MAALIITACGAQAIYGVTPAPDKLTFLFFYTENWAPWAAMEPVVNGMEETYQAQIEFESIDAATKEGQTFFRFYGLPGHPGFVLLNPEGDVLWKGFGEQSIEYIESNIDAAIASWSTSPWYVCSFDFDFIVVFTANDCDINPYSIHAATVGEYAKE